MSSPSLIGLFVRPLNRLDISFMVTGGVAAVVYGEPRFTRGIDLVIELRPADVARFADAWATSDFYAPPIEVIEEESRRSAYGHFIVFHHETALRADVYVAGDDPLNAWAFAHKVLRRVDEDDVVMAPVEAVILSELRYYQMGGSDRHLRDIGLMLKISGDQIDREELERWTVRLGVEKEWRTVQDY